MDKNTYIKDIESLERNANIYKSYEGEQKLTWCSGCGNYSIQNALRMALTIEEIPNHKACICFDVGCNGNGADKLSTYTVHGLHGRAIPLAAGIAVANPELTVVTSSGDGATYSEGANHLIHAIRSDYNLTFIQHNNSLFALTTGQASAATRRGMPLNSAPDGVMADPINPIKFVLSLNPTFVARTFSGDLEHMTEMIRAGIRHPGFSFIEVLQVCPTYSRKTGQKWFWDRVRYVEDIKDYNNSDIWAAMKVAEDMDNEIMLGLLYHDPHPGLACLRPYVK